MTLAVEWAVHIGDVATATDFSDRATGISIRQPLGFMQPASHQCVLTLNNFDGALTPGAGGTYSSINWFKQAIFVTCTVNGTDTAEVFHGIIDDFDLADDGTNSVVTVTALDWFSIGARAFAQQNSSVSTPIPWTERVQATINAATVSYGYPSLPALNQTLGVFTFYFVPLRNEEYAAGSVTIGTYREKGDALADIQFKYEQAGVPSTIWPTTIEQYTDTYGYDYALYRAGVVGDTLTRTDTGATTFRFTENTPAAGQLPVGEIDRGYNIDRVLNNASVTSVFTTNTSISTDNTSTGTIGAKSITARASAMTDDDDVQRMTDNIVARFANVHFMARKLQVDSAQWAPTDAGSKEELAQLLDVRYGLWQAAAVTYTPTGTATQQTDHTVIAGRTIQATPHRTTITLDLLPAADYQSFTLNSDVLGVLDQNRLG